MLGLTPQKGLYSNYLEKVTERSFVLVLSRFQLKKIELRYDGSTNAAPIIRKVATAMIIPSKNMILLVYPFL